MGYYKDIKVEPKGRSYMIYINRFQNGHEHYNYLTERIELENCNSAGGVDVYLWFHNANTEKTIKYITFEVSPRNAVGDDVECTIRNRSVAYLSYTGPLDPGKEDGGAWENVWYNTTIRTCVLSKITIEYMDGTVEEQTTWEYKKSDAATSSEIKAIIFVVIFAFVLLLLFGFK